MTEPIVFDLRGECLVEITEFNSKNGEKAYRLTWGDYVINSWTEYYPTLSLAFARVAVLADCLDDDKVFEKESLDFTFHASRFLAEQSSK